MSTYQALDAAFQLLQKLGSSTVHVLRDTAFPQPVPSGGLIILQSGEPGEPTDSTLNPRTDYYEHRAQIEIFAPADTICHELAEAIEDLVLWNPDLGGAVGYCYIDGEEMDRLDIEGAGPIITSTLDFILEYSVRDPLAA